MTRAILDDEFAKFKAYIDERKVVGERRLAGEPWPWSQDPIFQTKFFCNVLRDNDRTSKEAREFIQALSPSEQLPATMWFRIVNRVDTLKAIVASGQRKADQIEAILNDLPMVFNTVAYRVQVKGGLWNKPSVSKMISRAYRVVVTDEWRPRKLAQYTCDALRGALDMGPFLAYQAMQDIRWTGHRYEDENSWCYIGPGAYRGIRRLTGEFKATDLVMGHRNRLQGSAPSEGEQIAILPLIKELVGHLGINAFEIEHNLCEFDKIERIRNGETGGRSYARRD